MLDDQPLGDVEKAEKSTLQKLLFCLLKIISGSDVATSVKSCEKLVVYMKKINLIFDSFKPIPQLLKQLNLKRLMDYDRSGIVFDLVTFILRYFSYVDYQDFDLSGAALEKVKKEEVKRIWTSVDYLLSKFEALKEDIRGKNKLTAKALGEIFSYLSDFKKDYDGIGPQLSASQ